VGLLEPGPLNSITDVAGVAVGHSNHAPDHVGVTVVDRDDEGLPGDRDVGFHGHGELTGCDRPPAVCLERRKLCVESFRVDNEVWQVVTALRRGRNPVVHEHGHVVRRYGKRATSLGACRRSEARHRIRRCRRDIGAERGMKGWAIEEPTGSRWSRRTLG